MSIILYNTIDYDYDELIVDIRPLFSTIYFNTNEQPVQSGLFVPITTKKEEAYEYLFTDDYEYKLYTQITLRDPIFTNKDGQTVDVTELDPILSFIVMPATI